MSGSAATPGAGGATLTCSSCGPHPDRFAGRPPGGSAWSDPRLTYEQPAPPATLVSRHAEALQPNHRPAVTDPHIISLDRASPTTRSPGPHPVKHEAPVRPTGGGRLTLHLTRRYISGHGV